MTNPSNSTRGSTQMCKLMLLLCKALSTHLYHTNSTLPYIAVLIPKSNAPRIFATEKKKGKTERHTISSDKVAFTLRAQCASYPIRASRNLLLFVSHRIAIGWVTSAIRSAKKRLRFLLLKWRTYTNTTARQIHSFPYILNNTHIVVIGGPDRFREEMGLLWRMDCTPSYDWFKLVWSGISMLLLSAWCVNSGKGNIYSSGVGT